MATNANKDKDKDATSPPTTPDPVVTDAENVAASTGNPAEAENIADRTETIKAQTTTRKGKTSAGTNYAILHTQVDDHPQGSIATFDHLDDAGRQRLLDLGAVRVATAAEKRAGRADVDEDE